MEAVGNVALLMSDRGEPGSHARGRRDHRAWCPSQGQLTRDGCSARSRHSRACDCPSSRSRGPWAPDPWHWRRRARHARGPTPIARCSRASTAPISPASVGSSHLEEVVPLLDGILGVGGHVGGLRGTEDAGGDCELADASARRRCNGPAAEWADESERGGRYRDGLGSLDARRRRRARRWARRAVRERGSESCLLYSSVRDVGQRRNRERCQVLLSV